MQSRESKYPLNVLSLVSTKPDYDSNTRTISLTVVRFQIAREGSDALHLQMNICTTTLFS